MSKILLILLPMLLFATPVFAGNTSLSRSSFIITGEPGVVTSETLAVNNISPAGQIYQFSLSGLDDKTVSILPRQFWLAPGHEQTVVLRFRPNPSVKDAHIDLLAFDSREPSNFKIAQGVKLPVRFFASAVAGAQTFAQQQPGMPLGAKVWIVLVYAVDLSLFFALSWLYYQRRLRVWRRPKINFL